MIKKLLTQQSCEVPCKGGIRALDNKFSLLKAQKIYYKALTNFRICYKALIIVTALLTLVVQSGAAGNAEELSRQVRAVETAFAKTMADRDWAAFKAHISEEAVFFSRKGVLRGKNAIAEGWKPYFAGAKAPFSWKPEQVEVLDSGTLALSSGPVIDAEGKHIATFQSIWRLEVDGQWKIIFDKGCPACN